MSLMEDRYLDNFRVLSLVKISKMKEIFHLLDIRCVFDNNLSMETSKHIS